MVHSVKSPARVANGRHQAAMLGRDAKGRFVAKGSRSASPHSKSPARKHATPKKHHKRASPMRKLALLY